MTNLQLPVIPVKRARRILLEASYFMRTTWYAERPGFKTVAPRLFKRPQPSPRDWWGKTLNYLADKELRSTIAGLSSVFAFLMIGGYYLWLGFTPSFGLGQATLLLLQACIVGFIVTVYFAAMLFLPAICYRALDLEIDDFPKDQQSRAISSLTMRSIAAQACLFSLLVLLAFIVSSEFEGDFLIYAVSSFVVFTCSSVVLLKLPRTTAFGKKESLSEYLASLLAHGGGGFIAAVMLHTMYTLPKEREPVGAGYFIAGLVMVTVISAAISTLRKKHRPGGFLVGLLAFAGLLLMFDSAAMPFKATANALGIAAARPVELVLSVTTCPQVKQLLVSQEKLHCDGPAAGVLHDVRLLNTLGDRWVIREAGSTENIIFEGKDVAVRIASRKTQ